MFEFVETIVFSRRLAALAARETLLAIQRDLIEDPVRWPVIRGTGGARKGRIADPLKARGKSGSYRYLYLYLPHVQRIYLLFIFDKKEQDNLSAAQKNSIARLIAAIHQEAS